MTLTEPNIVAEGVLFEPDTAHAMVVAFEDICRAMNLPDTATSERETIAVRIIELGRQGLLDPQLLRDRILREARLKE